MWEPTEPSGAAKRAARYRARKKGREQALSDALWAERYAHQATKKELEALRAEVPRQLSGQGARDGGGRLV